MAMGGWGLGEMSEATSLAQENYPHPGLAIAKGSRQPRLEKATARRRSNGRAPRWVRPRPHEAGPAGAFGKPYSTLSR